MNILATVANFILPGIFKEVDKAIPDQDLGARLKAGIQTAVLSMGDCSNGIEIILEMDCGAVTTKDFYATDWQVCLKTLAQICVVPRFEEDFLASKRYYERSYEYGTANGTNTQNGAFLYYLGNSVANANGIGNHRIRVDKSITPNFTVYSKKGNRRKNINH